MRLRQKETDLGFHFPELLCQFVPLVTEKFVAVGQKVHSLQFTHHVRVLRGCLSVHLQHATNIVHG